MRHENSRFAPQSKYPWGAPRTPCKARLCATFDLIRGGLCPLELPLRKRTADHIKGVYRQAEQRKAAAGRLSSAVGDVAEIRGAYHKAAVMKGGKSRRKALTKPPRCGSLTKLSLRGSCRYRTLRYEKITEKWKKVVDKMGGMW